MLKITLRGIFFAIGLLVICPQLTLAGDVWPEANSQNGSDATLKNCAFITHDCELCSVAASGRMSCSSVGVACEATTWHCLVPVQR